MRHPGEPDEPVLRRADVQDGPVARAGRRLLAETVADCRATEASLWLVSPDGQQMEGTLNQGNTPHILERISVPVTDSVVGMVASSGLASSIGPDDPQNTSVAVQTKLAVKAMIVAPVFVAGKLCGALSAINPTGGRVPAEAAQAAGVGASPSAPRGVFSSDDLETLQWKAFLMGLILHAHVEAQ